MYKDKGGGFPLSIKLGVYSGCFHREHSPRAYKLIDDFLDSSDRDEFIFEEHESGPEILVWVAAISSIISISANIINLITAIIKSRNVGIKMGDRPQSLVELNLRYLDKEGNLRNETILKINASENIINESVKLLLEQSLQQILQEYDKE
jgi:hypothetical protein